MPKQPQTHRRSTTPSPRPTLALIGGFLGAGKTTLIGRLAACYQSRGLRCAVVSNDQSVGLVDSMSARLLGTAAVAEVTGACFCCKLDDLVGVIETLQRDERPDVILCEPVGSCTDLMATVILPLEQVYQTGGRLAPFTVVLDARRAMAGFGGVRPKRNFAKDVGYIFRKQVEEAECLFINKAEHLDVKEQERLRMALGKEFPGKELRFGSAKGGDGVMEWADGVLGVESPEMGDHGNGASVASTLTERRYKPLMDVDYAVYARGEAMLGWYNAALTLGTDTPLDGNEWLLKCANGIADLLIENGCEVAHFKMSLERHGSGEGAAADVAIVNQVLSEQVPSSSLRMADPFTDATLLINLRAEGDAGRLRDFVRAVIDRSSAAPTMRIVWTDEAAFQPGEPKPTHRITHAANGSASSK